MSALVELQEAIITQLKAYAPKLKQVRPHEGRFTENSLRNLMALHNSAHVAILSFDKGQARSDGSVDKRVTVSVYLVTKETAAESKGHAALGFAEAIALWVFNKTFGIDCAHPAGPASARSLASTGLGSNVTTLWAVEWDQMVNFDGTPPSDPEGQLPTEIYLGRAPEIGADHVYDYILVSGAAA